MTADPTIPCPACSNAAAIWEAAKAAAEAGTDNRYCLTHNTPGWCETCESRMEAAADRYDPDAERVTSRRPA